MRHLDVEAFERLLRHGGDPFKENADSQSLEQALNSNLLQDVPIHPNPNSEIIQIMKALAEQQHD